jgi:hypothetical protein
LTALAAVPGLRQSAAVGLFFNQADTRTIAQAFVESRLPAGSTVLVQPYSVPLTQSRESLVEALAAKLGDPGRASVKFALRLQVVPWPAPAFRTLYLGAGGLDADKIYVGYQEFAGGRAADVFDRLGVDYVILKRYPIDDPATLPLRSSLAVQGRLLFRTSPYRPGTSPDEQAMAPPFQHNTDTPIAPALERPGPIVEVWAVR